jgi:hypothetical protein
LKDKSTKFDPNFQVRNKLMWWVQIRKQIGRSCTRPIVVAQRVVATSRVTTLSLGGGFRLPYLASPTTRHASSALSSRLVSPLPFPVPSGARTTEIGRPGH